MSKKLIVAGGGIVSASRADYISKANLSAEEKTERKLFSAEESNLSRRKATNYLAGGSNLQEGDVREIILSFQKEDYERFGEDSEARKEALESIVRAGLEKLWEELGVKNVRYIAGSHLNTNNPHAHIAYFRDATSIETNSFKRLSQIPRDWFWKINGENSKLGQMFEDAATKHTMATPPPNVATKSDENVFLPAGEFDDARIEKTLNRLSEINHIAPQHIEQLTDNRVLYVSRQGALVFLRRDVEGKTTGYVYEAGYQPSEESGFFYIGDPKTATRFVIAENPKEVLAALELTAHRDLSKVCIVASDKKQSPVAFTNFMRDRSAEESVRVVWALGLDREGKQETAHYEDLQIALTENRGDNAKALEFYSWTPKAGFGRDWSKQLKFRNLPGELNGIIKKILVADEKFASALDEKYTEQYEEKVKATFDSVITENIENEFVVYQKLADGKGIEYGRYVSLPPLETDEFTTPEFSMVLSDGVQWGAFNDELEVINEVQQNYERKIESEFLEAAAATEIESENLTAESDNVETAEAVTEMQPARILSAVEITERLKEIPLEDVMPRLGLQLVYDQKRFEYVYRDAGDRFKIKLTKDLFSDRYDDRRGGRNPINLVMHVQGTSFPEARQFLIENFGTQYIPQETSEKVLVREAAEKTKLPFVLPEPNDNKLPAVVRYLTEKRAISDDIVNTMIENGFVFANNFSSPVFINKDENDGVKGASWRATVGTKRGDYTGSEKVNAWFYVGNPKTATRFVIVESPIEAMSYFQLHRESLDLDKTAVISTATNSVPLSLVKLLEQNAGENGELVIAYNNDSRGQDGALYLLEKIGRFSMLKHKAHFENNTIETTEFSGRVSLDVPQAKDWNEDLIIARDGERNEADAEHIQSEIEAEARPEFPEQPAEINELESLQIVSMEGRINNSDGAERVFPVSFETITEFNEYVKIEKPNHGSYKTDVVLNLNNESSLEQTFLIGSDLPDTLEGLIKNEIVKLERMFKSETFKEEVGGIQNEINGYKYLLQATQQIIAAEEKEIARERNPGLIEAEINQDIYETELIRVVKVSVPQHLQNFGRAEILLATDNRTDKTYHVGYRLTVEGRVYESLPDRNSKSFAQGKQSLSEGHASLRRAVHDYWTEIGEPRFTRAETNFDPTVEKFAALLLHKTEVSSREFYVRGFEPSFSIKPELSAGEISMLRKWRELTKEDEFYKIEKVFAGAAIEANPKRNLMYKLVSEGLIKTRQEGVDTLVKGLQPLYREAILQIGKTAFLKTLKSNADIQTDALNKTLHNYAVKLSDPRLREDERDHYAEKYTKVKAEIEGLRNKPLDARLSAVETEAETVQEVVLGSNPEADYDLLAANPLKGVYDLKAHKINQIFRESYLADVAETTGFSFAYRNRTVTVLAADEKGGMEINFRAEGTSNEGKTQSYQLHQLINEGILTKDDFVRFVKLSRTKLAIREELENQNLHTTYAAQYDNSLIFPDSMGFRIKSKFTDGDYILFQNTATSNITFSKFSVVDLIEDQKTFGFDASEQREFENVRDALVHLNSREDFFSAEKTAAAELERNVEKTESVQARAWAYTLEELNEAVWTGEINFALPGKQMRNVSDLVQVLKDTRANGDEQNIEIAEAQLNDFIRDFHRGAVLRAYAEGKPVPENVLAEYPQIAETRARKAAAIILPPAEQSGRIETRIAKILHAHNIGNEIAAATEGFYVRLKNDPWMDLHITKDYDSNLIRLTHYYEQNGDLMHDGEMTFRLSSDGKLNLDKIAVALYGTPRYAYDRSFANMFSKNLIDQGFEKAELVRPHDEFNLAENEEQENVTEKNSSRTPATFDALHLPDDWKEESHFGADGDVHINAQDREAYARQVFDMAENFFNERSGTYSDTEVNDFIRDNPIRTEGEFYIHFERALEFVQQTYADEVARKINFEGYKSGFTQISEAEFAAEAKNPELIEEEDTTSDRTFGENERAVFFEQYKAAFNDEKTQQIIEIVENISKDRAANVWDLSKISDKISNSDIERAERNGFISVQKAFSSPQENKVELTRDGRIIAEYFENNTISAEWQMDGDLHALLTRAEAVQQALNEKFAARNLNNPYLVEANFDTNIIEIGQRGSLNAAQIDGEPDYALWQMDGDSNLWQVAEGKTYPATREDPADFQYLEPENKRFVYDEAIEHLFAKELLPQTNISINRRTTENRYAIALEVEPADVKKGTISLALDVRETLHEGKSIGNNVAFNKLCETHFGGSRAAGTFGARDAYDALELGVNLYILDNGKDFLNRPAPETLKEIRQLLRRLPTQTDRTEEQQLFQQFSTVPTESFVAFAASGMRTGDIVLEPSAGTAGLAVWSKTLGIETHVNEMSSRRAGILKILGFDSVSRADAQFLNDTLDQSIKPTLIMMNPPFSATGGRTRNRTIYGAEHITDALLRLEDGGRLVAIVGEGMAFERPTFTTWWADVLNKYNVRANVGVPGDEYAKYGTSFGNQILVIDKTGRTGGETMQEQLQNVVRGDHASLDSILEVVSRIGEERRVLAAQLPEKAFKSEETINDNVRFYKNVGENPLTEFYSRQDGYNLKTIDGVVDRIASKSPLKGETGKLFNVFVKSENGVSYKLNIGNGENSSNSAEMFFAVSNGTINTGDKLSFRGYVFQATEDRALINLSEFPEEVAAGRKFTNAVAYALEITHEPADKIVKTEKVAEKEINPLTALYEKARWQAIGIATGERVERVEQRGYRVIFGLAEGEKRYDIAGIIGPATDSFIEAGLTIEKVKFSNFETSERITRADIKANPGKIFLFGDNLKASGYGGQAREMRGEVNSIGIPTKKEPSQEAWAYFTDADLESNRAAIDKGFAKLAKYAPETIVVFPQAGLGTGLADLENKAPRTFAYLHEKISNIGFNGPEKTQAAPSEIERYTQVGAFTEKEGKTIFEPYLSLSIDEISESLTAYNRERLFTGVIKENSSPERRALETVVLSLRERYETLKNPEIEIKSIWDAANYHFDRRADFERAEKTNQPGAIVQEKYELLQKASRIYETELGNLSANEREAFIRDYDAKNNASNSNDETAAVQKSDDTQGSAESVENVNADYPKDLIANESKPDYGTISESNFEDYENSREVLTAPPVADDEIDFGGYVADDSKEKSKTIVNLNEKELAVFTAAAQQIVDCTGGQFGYLSEAETPGGITRAEFAGYSGILAQKGLISISDDEFKQMTLTPQGASELRGRGLFDDRSFELTNGEWSEAVQPKTPTLNAETIAFRANQREERESFTNEFNKHFGEIAPELKAVGEEKLYESGYLEQKINVVLKTGDEKKTLGVIDFTDEGLFYTTDKKTTEVADFRLFAQEVAANSRIVAEADNRAERREATIYLPATTIKNQIADNLRNIGWDENVVVEINQNEKVERPEVLIRVEQFGKTEKVALVTKNAAGYIYQPDKTASSINALDYETLFTYVKEDIEAAKFFLSAEKAEHLETVAENQRKAYAETAKVLNAFLLEQGRADIKGEVFVGQEDDAVIARIDIYKTDEINGSKQIIGNVTQGTDQYQYVIGEAENEVYDLGVLSDHVITAANTWSVAQMSAPSSPDTAESLIPEIDLKAYKKATAEEPSFHFDENNNFSPEEVRADYFNETRNIASTVKALAEEITNEAKTKKEQEIKQKIVKRLENAKNELAVHINQTGIFFGKESEKYLKAEIAQQNISLDDDYNVTVKTAAPSVAPTGKQASLFDTPDETAVEAVRDKTEIAQSAEIETPEKNVVPSVEESQATLLPEGFRLLTAAEKSALLPHQQGQVVFGEATSIERDAEIGSKWINAFDGKTYEILSVVNDKNRQIAYLRDEEGNVDTETTASGTSRSMFLPIETSPKSREEGDDLNDVIGVGRNTAKRERIDNLGVVAYKPAKLTKGVDHPGDIVESASMAAVEPPDIKYTPKLDRKIISEGKLSSLQLEAVIYAGQRHEHKLPNGNRAAIFIGDGTGVGKGRELAGIALDNWNQGRKRVLWLSINYDLVPSTKRDLDDLKAKEIPLSSLDKHSIHDNLDDTVGNSVLFASYATLIGKGKDEKTRYDQIVKWLGEDGVILFDEGHLAKNAVSFGMGEASQRGEAVVELQVGEKSKPNWRIVYSSATGATELANMGYMERLGLWGEGTGFPGGFVEFHNTIDKGGIGAMEMVARDMKASGMYMSRSLSFRGVDYRQVHHEITPEQKEIYNISSRAWSSVVVQFDDALKQTNANSRTRMMAYARLWSGQQMFYRQLMTALKVPAVIRETERVLEKGSEYTDPATGRKSIVPAQVVIGVIGTGEARTKDQVSKAMQMGLDLESLDFSPKNILLNVVETAFPTKRFTEELDPASGKTVKVPVVDNNGKHVESQEALMMRDLLLAELNEKVVLPDNPLDQIVNYFGENAVAEITGRKRRIIIDPNTGERTYAKRAREGVAMDKASQDEMNAFQANRKRIAIISQSASTGISLHADQRSESAGFRRVHITLETSWSADVQMQTFGRSHRSNQTMPPEYVLMSTDLGGEKRFLSTIAKRLSSLGALTKGDREQAGGGDLLQYDFENKYGVEAAKKIVGQMRDDKASLMTLLPPDPVSGEERSGLRMLYTMGLAKREGNAFTVTEETMKNLEVSRFLNRVLMLDVDTQNAVFDAFVGEMENIIKHHKDLGLFDEGVQDIEGENIRFNAEPRVVSTDKSTGAHTYHVQINADTPTHPATLRQLAERNQAVRLNGIEVAESKNKGVFYQQINSKNIIYAEYTSSRADAQTGSMEKFYRFARPSGMQSYLLNEKELSEKFTPVQLDQQRTFKDDVSMTVKDWWNKEVSEVPKTQVDNYHLITGAVLPVWQRLSSSNEAGNQMSLKTVRIETNDGTRVVGVQIPNSHINRVLRDLGVEQSYKTPEEVFDAVINTKETIDLVSGVKLKPEFLKKQPVIRIVNLTQSQEKQFFNFGALQERPGFSEIKYFVPSDREKGIEVLTKILEAFPAVDTSEKLKPQTQVEAAKTQKDDTSVADAVKNTLDSMAGGRISFGDGILAKIGDKNSDFAKKAEVFADQPLSKYWWMLKAETNEAGQVLLKPASYEFARATYKEATGIKVEHFDGLFNNELVTERFFESLDRKIESGGIYAESIKSFRKTLSKGREASENNVLVLLTDQRASRHEELHVASHVASLGKSLEERHEYFEELRNHEAYILAKTTLSALHKTDNDGILVEECFVEGASGNAEKIGLLPDESAEFTELWFKSFAAKNGIVSKEKFKELTDESRKIRDEAYNAIYADQLRRGAAAAVESAGIKTAGESLPELSERNIKRGSNQTESATGRNVDAAVFNIAVEKSVAPPSKVAEDKIQNEIDRINSLLVAPEGEITVGDRVNYLLGNARVLDVKTDKDGTLYKLKSYANEDEFWQNAGLTEKVERSTASLEDFQQLAKNLPEREFLSAMTPAHWDRSRDFSVGSVGSFWEEHNGDIDRKIPEQISRWEQSPGVEEAKESSPEILKLGDEKKYGQKTPETAAQTNNVQNTTAGLPVEVAAESVLEQPSRNESLKADGGDVLNNKADEDRAENLPASSLPPTAAGDDEIFETFKSVFKEAGIEKILESKDGFAEFETPGRNPIRYQMELTPNGEMKFAEMEAVSDNDDSQMVSRGIAFSKDSEGDYRYTGSFQRIEGTSKTTEICRDEAVGHYDADFWKADGLGKNIIVRELDLEETKITDALRESNNRNLDRYQGEQLGRQLIADANLKEAQFALAEFERNFDKKEFAVKLNDGEQKISLENLELKRLAYAQTEVAGDKKMGILAMIVEDGELSLEEAGDQSFARAMKAAEDFQKPQFQAVLAEVGRERSQLSEEIRQKRLVQDATAMDTEAVVKQNGSRTGIQPRLPIETIWSEQIKAAQRNDLEIFTKLEELHTAENIPRPNDVYARLRGVELLKTLEAEKQEQAVRDAIGSKNPKTLLVTLQRGASGLEVAEAKVKETAVERLIEEISNIQKHEREIYLPNSKTLVRAYAETNPNTLQKEENRWRIQEIDTTKNAIHKSFHEIKGNYQEGQSDYMVREIVIEKTGDQYTISRLHHTDEKETPEQGADYWETKPVKTAISLAEVKTEIGALHKNLKETLLTGEYVQAKKERTAEREESELADRLSKASAVYDSTNQKAIEYRGQAADERQRANSAALQPLRYIVDPFAPAAGKLAWFTHPKETLNAHINPIEIIKNDPAVQIVRAVSSYFEHQGNAKVLDALAQETLAEAALLKQKLAPEVVGVADKMAKAMQSAVMREENLRTALKPLADTDADLLKTPERALNDGEIKNIGKAATELGDSELLEKFNAVVEADPELARRIGETSERIIAKNLIAQAKAANFSIRAIDSVTVTDAGAIEVEINPARLIEAENQLEMSRVAQNLQERIIEETVNVPRLDLAEAREADNLTRQLVEQDKTTEFITNQYAKAGEEMAKAMQQPLNRLEQDLMQKMILSDEVVERFAQIQKSELTAEELYRQADLAVANNAQFQNSGQTFEIINPNDASEAEAREFWRADRERREAQIAAERLMDKNKFKQAEAEDLAEAEKEELEEIAATEEIEEAVMAM